MNESPSVSSRGKWLALTAALLGWLFDGAEMGIFSLVGRPAIKELLGTADEGQIGLWFNIIIAAFLVGAATGGVVFGWLGDRIGRVGAMTLSVLTYAVFTGLCAFCTQAWQVGVLRFIASLGMGGEWSLGVALVMEIWPNRSRAFMAGLIGAAANVGYLLVGVLGIGIIQFLGSIHAVLVPIVGIESANTLANPQFFGWRIMMLMGLLPAVLTFFIRLFVPESEKWKHERDSRTTNNFATSDLLGVVIGLFGPALIIYLWAWDGPQGFQYWTAVRIVGTIAGLAVTYVGYTFPILRFFQRRDKGLVAAGAAPHVVQKGTTIYRMTLGALLSGIALLGTWGSTQNAPSWVDKMVDKQFSEQKQALVDAGKADEAQALVRPRGKEYTLIWLSVGAIIGTILAALLGDLIGRRPAYFLLCVLSLGSAWMLFIGNSSYGPTLLIWACIAGACTASFYGWLPLYLPELFGTSVRATGQGFSFNFGRVLAAIGTLQVGNLIKSFSEPAIVAGITIPAGHPVACSTISLIYVVGMVVIWFAPETRGKPLPE